MVTLSATTTARKARTSLPATVGISLVLALATVSSGDAAFSADQPCLGLPPQDSVQSFLGATLEYEYATKYCCEQNNPDRFRAVASAFLSDSSIFLFDKFFEPEGYLEEPQVDLFGRLAKNPGENQTITFYDSVCGIPLFVAPRGRTFQEFAQESRKRGYLMFRREEIVSGNVVLAGQMLESKCSTFLGRKPNPNVEEYQVNLVCVAGAASSKEDGKILKALVDRGITTDWDLVIGSNKPSSYADAIHGTNQTSSHIEDGIGLDHKYGITVPLDFFVVIFFMVYLGILSAIWSTFQYMCTRRSATVNSTTKKPCRISMMGYSTLALVLILLAGSAALWYCLRNNVQVHPAMMVAIPIFSTTILAFILALRCVGKDNRDKIDRLLGAIFDNANNQGRTKATIEVNDRYMDFSKSTISSVALGFTQTLLFAYYFFAIMRRLSRNNNAIDCGDIVDSLTLCQFDSFYFSGLFATFGYLLGIGKFKTPLRTVTFWRTIERIEHENRTRGGSVKYHPESNLSEHPWVRNLELNFRGILSLFMNVLGFCGLVLCIPIQVSLADFENSDSAYIDFVFNLVAGFFIIEMDDITTQVYQVVYTPADPIAAALTAAIESAKRAADITRRSISDVEADVGPVRSASDAAKDAASASFRTLTSSSPRNPSIAAAEMTTDIAALVAADFAAIVSKKADDVATALDKADVAINVAISRVAMATNPPKTVVHLFEAIALRDGAKTDAKKMMNDVIDVVTMAVDAVDAASSTMITDAETAESAAAVATWGMQEASSALKDIITNVDDAPITTIATAARETVKKTLAAAKAIRTAVSNKNSSGKSEDTVPTLY